MGRILAIDYGLKRTGLAVTDPLQIITSKLPTVETEHIWTFLKSYFTQEEVEHVVIGMPTNLDCSPTDATPAVEKFISIFREKYPSYKYSTIDERMTSKMAERIIAQSGLPRKKRQKKEHIDAISASIILQDYLNRR